MGVRVKSYGVSRRNSFDFFALLHCSVYLFIYCIESFGYRRLKFFNLTRMHDTFCYLWKEPYRICL